MTVYVITENVTQSKFIDKFGEDAKPFTRVLGVRKTQEEAKSFKSRMNAMLQEEAYVEGNTEDITIEIIPINMP